MTHRCNILYMVAAALLLAALPSCKLGPKYVRPESGLPERYISAPADTFSLADLKWWEIYSDPTLQSLIAATLANNNDLKASEARVMELAARKRVATADLLPQLGGNVYAQKEALNYGGDNLKPDPELGIKASLSWEVDLWGNLCWARDRSSANLRESLENRRALMVSLVGDVAENYFKLIALHNEHRIVARTLVAREEGVRLARIRYEGGLTSETSYLQAQVEYARTATHLPVLERDIALTENELSYLTNDWTLHLDVEPSGFFSSDSIEWLATLPAGLPSELLERRPDIRAAEQRLIAANASVGMAYTNRFPRLALTAQYGAESETLASLFRSPMYFLGASLLGPVFDFGRRQGEYRASQHACEQARYAYAQTVMNAFKEVRNAIISFNKTTDICRSMAQLERSAKSTVELAQLQYINGVIGYLDLLDAQRSYFDAQLGLSNAICTKRLAAVQLYKALGGGW